jgi:hypothetical protein
MFCPGGNAGWLAKSNATCILDGGDQTFSAASKASNVFIRVAGYVERLLYVPGIGAP